MDDKLKLMEDSQQPSITDIPPLLPSSEEHSLRETWRAFFSLTGGSPVYCLSALSIIYGIASILGPVLAQADFLREAVPCLVALNVYEVTLLAVLTVIVAWRHVLDDAISLVVLVALFLAGTGITLTALADSAPRVAMFIGGGCVALGAAKLVTLRRIVGLRFSTPVLTGCLLLLVWNFSIGALFGSRLGGAPGATAERLPWLLSWCVVLVAGGLLLIDMVKPRKETRDATSADQPFLRQPAMVWVFSLLLILIACAHQEVLSYIFDVRSKFSDYLPVISIISLALLQLSLSFGRKVAALEIVIAATPLALCGATMMFSSIAAVNPTGIEYLWHPAVLLAVTGLALLWLARVNNAPLLLWVCAGYALGVMLTAKPTGQLISLNLNWDFTGGVLVVGLLLFGLRKRNPALCFAAVTVTALGLTTMGGFRSLAMDLGLEPFGAMAGVLGLGTLALVLFFGRTPALMMVAGAIATTACAFSYLYPTLSGRDILVAAVLLALIGGLWWRTRYWPAMIILALPLPLRLWLVFMELAAWRFVLLGFLLLFGGAALSWWKGTQVQAKAKQKEMTRKDSAPPLI